MKIAVVPDIHLNKTVFKGVMDRDISDLPFRNVDFMKAFAWAVDKNISEIKPDLFVIPGDIYDHPDPSNKVRRFFSKQLRKLNKADIPVIILIGNHDVSKREHAISDIFELQLPKTVVIEKPTINTYKGVKLLLFPYSLEVEQKKKTIKQDFTDFVDEIHKQKLDMPSIFFGHFGVKGASMNQYTEEEVIDQMGQVGELTDTVTKITAEVKHEFINNNPKDISLDDLDGIGAEYVMLGDYHKHQVLPTKKCIAMYPGSLEKTNALEADLEKGFVVFDSEAKPDKKMGKCQFIVYPNCRPMIEINGTLSKIRENFKKLDPDKYKGAIVKLGFHGTKDELIDFSSGLETLKREIRDTLNPIHVYNQNDVIDEEQREAATKLETEILKKGHLEAEDVIDCVKEMLEERIKDEKEKKLTIDLTVEEYEEYKEAKKNK